MTLRDWFAGKALPHYLALSDSAADGGVDTIAEGKQSASEEAYEAADAMLAARGE
jgi:rubrerythrin